MSESVKEDDRSHKSNAMVVVAEGGVGRKGWKVARTLVRVKRVAGLSMMLILSEAANIVVVNILRSSVHSMGFPFEGRHGAPIRSGESIC